MSRRDGEGSVSLRANGRWLAQLPPSLGRKSKTFDTELEGEAWLRAELAKVTLGISDEVFEGNSTVEEAVEVWLVGSLNKPSTKDQHRIYINRFIKDRPFGYMLMRAVRPMHIDALVESAPENWSRVHLCGMLATFFDWAEMNGIIGSNAFRRSQARRARLNVMQAHSRREEVDTVWSPDEFARFLAEETDPIYRDFWIVAAVTAARRGEVLGMTWGNTNLDEGWAWIKDNITRGATKVVNTGSPKNRTRRKVYFAPVIVDVLDDRLIEQDRYRETCDTWSGDWVFDKRRARPMSLHVPGDHMTPEMVTRRFNWLADRANLPALGGPHGLRRTFATIAKRQKFDKHLRSLALGHGLSVTDEYVKEHEPEVRELFECVTKEILSLVY